MEFKSLLSPADAIGRFLNAWRPPAMRCLRVPIEHAGGMVLALDAMAGEDLPGFDKSTMDGYAVRAADTFGATESMPALLTVAGEAPIGQMITTVVKPGEAMRIATGAMIPPGADAVVMVEYVDDLGTGVIAVGKDVAPGENVISRGEDLGKGDPVLRRGKRLRAQDIGAMSALGVTEVTVYQRPVVYVVSTGNEIVSPSKEPRPGEVRDTNGPALVAALAAVGCESRHAGIVRDEYSELTQALSAALESADAVVLSGGSSIGPHDLAPSAINDLGAPGVVIHGLAIKPGKPAILGLAGNKPVFGLPGHPASSLVVFQVVIEPLIRMLCGESGVSTERPSVTAVLDRNLPSVPGREDYVRVSLVDRAGVLHAVPVLGKSGLISTLVRSEGMVKIPLESGGYEAGETVRVILWTI